MDGLVEEGFIVLGGPVGPGDGDDTLVVVQAESEAEVRRRFAGDPWPEDVLQLVSIERWSLWLRAPGWGPSE